MSATLKDIAASTGLSVTQVSRALNDHDDVSAETKIRVREAANALNYRPNLSARKLASGRSGIVGLVLPPQDRTPRDSKLRFSTVMERDGCSSGTLARQSAALVRPSATR